MQRMISMTRNVHGHIICSCVYLFFNEVDEVFSRYSKSCNSTKNSVSTMKNDEIQFELLDMTTLIPKKGRGGWLDDAIKDLTKASVAKQLTVGGLSGWCSGYLCAKVGKTAAMAVGGTVLVLQFAIHKGYIQINWGEVNKDIEKAKKELKVEIKKAESMLPAILKETKRFVMQNIFLAGGFGGGFLLGIAS